MKQELPRYRLSEPAYLQPPRSVGAAKFEAGTEIAFEGAPTFGMMPLNPPARTAKAASIRARGMARLRKPPEGDRTVLITLCKSIGGSPGSIGEMADQIEQWLAAHPAPIPATS